MTNTVPELYRLDPLTGCNNFLSFVETLDHLSSAEERKSFSILYLDMNYMGRLNDTKGYFYGDSVLRWLSIVLQEECNSPVYRIGGDAFAVILRNGTHIEHEELLSHIFARLTREGEQLDIPIPPATIALIHFDIDYAFSINDIMFHLGETISVVKLNRDKAIRIFQARDLMKSTTKADEQHPDVVNHLWESLRSIANGFIDQIRFMGQILDVAQKTSLQDPISGLPNLRAALRIMDKAISDAEGSKQPFSILLTDGDNFRKYNSISYANGDEVIQKTGVVFSQHLRPGDFVARWRTGDEFIIVLPNTSSEGAKIVAKRFRLAIKEASKVWILPSSISIGIATYPQHASSTNELLDKAESALKRAKDQGKDRAILAE
jgi:diguanylate cyclase (GGDEF)-like protein